MHKTKVCVISAFSFHIINLLMSLQLLYYSHGLKVYPCALHSTGNKAFPMIPRPDIRRKARMIQFPASPMTSDRRCSAWAVVAGVFSGGSLIPQVARAHSRRGASAILTCSELISRGHCSRFSHLLLRGEDYGNTYGYAYIIVAAVVVPKIS